MKTALFTIVALFATSVFADARESQDWVPLKDPRVELSQCGSEGGTSEMRNPDTQKVCIGKVKETGSAVVIVINKRDTVYLRVLDHKVLREVGGQEAGERVEALKLAELDKSLRYVGRANSTARVRTTWTYSEGYTTISGKTPMGEVFGASLVPVDQPLDEE